MWLLKLKGTFSPIFRSEGAIFHLSRRSARRFVAMPHAERGVWQEKPFLVSAFSAFSALPREAVPIPVLDAESAEVLAKIKALL